MQIVQGKTHKRHNYVYLPPRGCLISNPLSALKCSGILHAFLLYDNHDISTMTAAMCGFVIVKRTKQKSCPAGI